jgi:hypothetical protein
MPSRRAPRSVNRLPSAEPYLKTETPPPAALTTDEDEFLRWLDERIQSDGYTIVTAPAYFKKAYTSRDSKYLVQTVSQEWWQYKQKVLGKKVWTVLLYGTKMGYFDSKEEADAYIATKPLNWEPLRSR